MLLEKGALRKQASDFVHDFGVAGLVVNEVQGGGPVGRLVLPDGARCAGPLKQSRSVRIPGKT